MMIETKFRPLVRQILGDLYMMNDDGRREVAGDMFRAAQSVLIQILALSYGADIADRVADQMCQMFPECQTPDDCDMIAEDIRREMRADVDLYAIMEDE